MQEAKYTTQTFGERLRELSDLRGPYSKIARDLGINRQQFARYLNGTSRPRDAIVRKRAEYFQVDPGVFFQDKPHVSKAVGSIAFDDAVALDLLKGVSHLGQEVISETELPSGFYMQYKQSFTQPDKVVCMLSKIYRSELGVTRCKRRYSVLVTRDLPGVRVWHKSYGVFIRNLGALVLFESDGVAGDLVFSAFKPASLFSTSERLKTGIVMTHGRPGALGPVAGRHLVEKIPDQASKLEWARRQGFRTIDELPDYVQYHFTSPPALPDGVMAVR